MAKIPNHRDYSAGTDRPATRRNLDKAAAKVAGHLGLKLRDPSVHLLDADKPKIAGYFTMRWRLVDPHGVPWGVITLSCEGGYGADPTGTGWFKGYVDVRRLDDVPTNLGGTLVGQWDFPLQGRESAKHTRIRFIRWADELVRPKPLHRRRRLTPTV